MARLLNTASAAYFRAAIEAMQARDPAHADLPGLVLTLHRIEHGWPDDAEHVEPIGARILAGLLVGFVSITAGALLSGWSF